MNGKQNLVSALWVVAGVVSLVPALVPVLKGESPNYTWLAIAFTFICCAFVFFAAGRKSGGSSDRPGA
jgi:hypothetical protein